MSEAVRAGVKEKYDGPDIRDTAERLLPPTVGGVASVEKRRKGRPRIEDKDKTVEAAKPWVAAGMSRRSWYRREAEKRGK